jgi:DNA replication initiation complex subunit (GINS family)
MSKSTFRKIDVESAIRNLRDTNSRIENHEDFKDWMSRKIESIEIRLNLIERDVEKIIRRP